MFSGFRRAHPDSQLRKDTSLSGQSISTQESDSPRCQNTYKYRPFNKDKLELCRKYTEFGYCPYEKKCKFAHGHHELRKNNSTNMKYKTKECVTFIQDGFCHYGSRCNFIHKDETRVTIEDLRKGARSEYRDIFYESNTDASRLQKLLKQ